jgi:hypothetical protein
MAEVETTEGENPEQHDPLPAPDEPAEEDEAPEEPAKKGKDAS